VNRLPRWAVPASLAFAIVGLAIAAYLAIAHFGSSHILACPSTGTIDCDRVTTSAQSTFLGVPVAVLGVAWFAAMAALCLPPAWRSSNPLVHTVRAVAAISGIAFVLWLVYAELFLIGAICLWCTGAHLMAFGLFAIVMTTWQFTPTAAGAQAR
jgi:uncharacterized membrane protein